MAAMEGLRAPAHIASGNTRPKLWGVRRRAAASRNAGQSKASSRARAQATASLGGNVIAATATASEVKMTPFATVKTKAEMLYVIKNAGLPPKQEEGMLEFFNSYLGAVESSDAEDPETVAVKVMGAVFDRVAMQMTEPYTFPSHHLSIREPYDYYAFGQNYIKPLLDYKNSYVGNTQLFDKMVDQLKEGHNIVLLANHQTEADPGVMAHMLEPFQPELATALTYVAGDRVVLDAFCKPFSMGRNLLCVHSKKHINDIPELAEEKLAANRRTLKEMAKLFKKGGNFVWIAPSGGRDRPDPVTDEWQPASFDSSAVELMRRLVEEAGRPFHLHPLALLCYDIMPPPRKIEKELGEKRVIGHHGVGIAVAPEVDFKEVTAGITDRKEGRDAFSLAVYNKVCEQYNVLFRAIHGGQGLSASTKDVVLSQPWAKLI